jgi:hypothetical protein
MNFNINIFHAFLILSIYFKSIKGNKVSRVIYLKINRLVVGNRLGNMFFVLIHEKTESVRVFFIVNVFLVNNLFR